MIDRMNDLVKQKKVIRIHDDGPFEICEYEQRYFLEIAIWKSSEKVSGWLLQWVRKENGEPLSFKRRCDASRYAGKHFKDYERQHWTISCGK
jgi:hypothetical protein